MKEGLVLSPFNPAPQRGRNEEIPYSNSPLPGQRHRFTRTESCSRAVCSCTSLSSPSGHYLRNAGVKPDCRVDEAIQIVIQRRYQNRRWPLNLLHPEEIPLKIEIEVARASRWNTLRALRVLRWYNSARPF